MRCRTLQYEHFKVAIACPRLDRGRDLRSSANGSGHSIDRLWFPSPICNDYNWGGYVTWKSDGQYLTSIDARSTPTLDGLFPTEVFVDYLTALEGRLDREAKVQRSPAQYALVPVSSAHIDSLPGWLRVYADEVAVLSVRDGAAWNCQPESP